MKYRHQFRVRASILRVSEFHSRSSSMPAITPPLMRVELHSTPEILAEGDEMDFTLRLGPLPINWLARIEQVSKQGFTDRQLRGPFAAWVHRHHFIEVDAHTTDVVDEISLRLSSQPFWWLVGMGMRIGLPVLFAFRAWKTKQLVEREKSL